jgi:hypothetical protein
MTSGVLVVLSHTGGFGKGLCSGLAKVLWYGVRYRGSVSEDGYDI